MFRTRLNVDEILKFGMFYNAKLSSTSYRLLIVIDPTITINQSKPYRLIDNQPASCVGLIDKKFGREWSWVLRSCGLLKGEDLHMELDLGTYLSRVAPIMS
jgi:hypothetical protein